MPERQINKKIYNSFELLVDQFKLKDWIKLYIFWELSLIKELGFEINFFDKGYTEDRTKIPKLLLDQDNKKLSNIGIKEALIFNKSLIMKNFILPHGLKLPLSRNILEKYYN